MTKQKTDTANKQSATESGSKQLASAEKSKTGKDAGSQSKAGGDAGAKKQARKR